MRQMEGYGRLTIEHNLNMTSALQSPGAWSIPVSYIGFTTDDELLAAIGMFTDCEQQIEFSNCPGMENTTYWISLTGDKWQQNQINNCRYKM